MDKLLDFLDFVNEGYEFETIEEKKKWMQDAFKKKGKLHKSMHVAADEDIPMDKINKSIERLHKKKKHTKADTKKLRELQLAKRVKKGDLKK